MASVGDVFTRIAIQSQRGEAQSESLEVLVDTGAALSVLPRPLLESLGIEVEGQATLRLADGRRTRRDVADVRMQVEGQWIWTGVVFGEPGDTTVLGLTALERRGLAVDPVERRLVPTDFILYCSPRTCPMSSRPNPSPRVR